MLKMPDYYVRVDSMPEDPAHSVPMCAKTSSAGIFVIYYPIDPNQAMPFGNAQAVIDGIHQALSDRQGLIEVDTDKTASGADYIYSIVKTIKEPHGVQYTLTYQIMTENEIVNLQGFFDEIGTTGIRDALVYEAYRSKGKFSDNMDGWMQDPYDPYYTQGIRMNLSEMVGIDSHFPEHPLSMARALVGYLCDNN